ncbi:MAG: hypothetical protein ROO73_01685 [Roseivirga sp.]
MDNTGQRQKQKKKAVPRQGQEVDTYWEEFSLLSIEFHYLISVNTPPSVIC